MGAGAPPIDLAVTSDLIERTCVNPPVMDGMSGGSKRVVGQDQRASG